MPFAGLTLLVIGLMLAVGGLREDPALSLAQRGFTLGLAAFDLALGSCLLVGVAQGRC
jgi:hypothetical protein